MICIWLTFCDSLYNLTLIARPFYVSSQPLSYPSNSSTLQVWQALNLNQMRNTFNIEGSWHKIPVVKKALNFRSGNCSIANPVLDSGQIESDLSIDEYTLPGCPIADVLDESSFDIFAIGCDDDPP